MGQKRDAPVELGRVLIKPPSAAPGAGMSAFGGRAAIEWCCWQCPLMTHSGHGRWQPKHSRNGMDWLA
jgi:hypothetical protein